MSVTLLFIAWWDTSRTLEIKTEINSQVTGSRGKVSSAERYFSFNLLTTHQGDHDNKGDVPQVVAGTDRVLHLVRLSEVHTLGQVPGSLLHQPLRRQLQDVQLEVSPETLVVKLHKSCQPGHFTLFIKHKMCFNRENTNSRVRSKMSFNYS